MPSAAAAREEFLRKVRRLELTQSLGGVCANIGVGTVGR
jgi:hypothetical protein